MPDTTLSRRAFLAASSAAAATPAFSQQHVPWYLRTYRWGQTNITERDPDRYDIPFWRAYWKRTCVQGVILNAGGIVAYYPSRFPLHKRAEYLKDRDLYGELARAAHDDGLVVLARMDSNRASEDFYNAHPDWFAIDASGKPYRAADKFITCINGPYYGDYLPGVITEIIERSKPEGVTDNSWAGLGRDSICYCENCKRRFGKPLPRKPDWDDPVYREWIEWSYARRVELWEANNRVTRQAGGEDCIWSGMLSGSLVNQSRTLRDDRELCRRAAIVMLDHQRRDERAGIQQNAETGKRLHGVLGWDKLIPESMAMYQAARTSFRLSAKPAAEARLWMVAGFAGGIQPWWHHVGAYHEDRRAYRTAEPVMRWHRDNEQYLAGRKPVAAVGVVWSRQNTDYWGRDNAVELVEMPYRGIVQALVHARIPYIPVHADDIDRDGAALHALVLPDMAVLSDPQCAAVARFVERGGGLLATGVTSALDARGTPREDFALASLLGASGARNLLAEARTHALAARHSYLRISAGPRGDVLAGFEETSILPFGGGLAPLRIAPGRAVPLTFIPAFPVYPPETAWMREEMTDIPGLVLSEGQGRVAYLPADIDRRLAREGLPDHARLLGNLIRWITRDRSPLRVEGRGLLDCHLYEQPGGRRVLHLVNLSHTGPEPVDELLPLGPFRVRLQAPSNAPVRLLVSGHKPPARFEKGMVVFDVPQVADHEVAVLG